jgi:hypothetical protein
MPFDALVAPVRPNSLVEVLEQTGITTVAWDALTTHKQTQLEKFAPSFWHQH